MPPSLNLSLRGGCRVVDPSGTVQRYRALLVFVLDTPLVKRLQPDREGCDPQIVVLLEYHTSTMRKSETLC